MTTKTYATTEEQRDALCGYLSDSGSEAANEYEDVIKFLPLITGEPVAWQIKFKDEHGTQRNVTYTHNAIGDYRQIDPNAVCVPLYTHPKPLQPITAEDVTDEMVFTHNTATAENSDHDYKIVIAAAVNAWIKHKGDTK